MFNLSVGEIITKINSATNLSPEVIQGRINNKIEELSGLVSEEGAAHIVANELGVSIIERSEDGKVQIRNLVPGLRNIDIRGSVQKIFPVHTFMKNDVEGKVGSMIVSDGTGEIRLVIWDHRVEHIEKGEIDVGSEISVRGAFVKEGKYGMEVHLRSTSDFVFEKKSIEFTPIKDIDEGVSSIRGTVNDLSSKNPFFEICSKCGKRVKDECPEHGKVEPKYSMVVELSISDNTGSIKCVCFGKAAEKAIQMKGEDALKIALDNSDKFLPLNMAKSNIIGKQVYVRGNVKNNSFTNKLEILADSVHYPDPEEEINYLKAR
jgi:ssDNA-binding replication factor A large subunit